MILKDILTSPRAGQVSADLEAADQLAAVGLDRYAAMEYGASVTYTKAAYEKVWAAAVRIQIAMEPQSTTADNKA